MAHLRWASRSGAKRLVAVGAAALLTTALLPGQAASAKPGAACDNRSNNTYQKLLACMTLDGVREHQDQRPPVPRCSTGHRRWDGDIRSAEGLIWSYTDSCLTT